MASLHDLPPLPSRQNLVFCASSEEPQEPPSWAVHSVFCLPLVWSIFRQDWSPSCLRDPSLLQLRRGRVVGPTLHLEGFLCHMPWFVIENEMYHLLSVWAIPMLKKCFFFEILDYHSTNFHLFALLSLQKQYTAQKAALFNLNFFFCFG